MNRYHFLALYDAAAHMIVPQLLTREQVELIQHPANPERVVECEIEDSASVSFLFYSNCIIDAGSLVILADRVRDWKHKTHSEFIEDWLMARFEVRKAEFPNDVTVAEIAEWGMWNMILPLFTANTVVNALNALRQEDWEAIVAAMQSEAQDTPIKVIDTGRDVFHIRECGEQLIVHQIKEV